MKKTVNLKKTSKGTKNNILLEIFTNLIVGNTLLTIIYFYLVPFILNFPDGTYNNRFQKELEGVTYDTQIIFISIAILAINFIVTFFCTRFLVKNNDVIQNPELYSEEDINFVKNKLFNMPNYFFAFNILIPSIVIPVCHYLTIKPLPIIIIKVFIIIFSLECPFMTIMYIHIKRGFKNILSNLPVTNLSQMKRTSISRNILVTIIPSLISSLIFLSFLGYTRATIEECNSSFWSYQNSLDNFCTYYEDEFDSLSRFIELSQENFVLLKSSDIFFIRLPDGTFLDRNYKFIGFSDFFVKYLNELSDQNYGRVYDELGKDSQAITSKVVINGIEYTVGVYFEAVYTDTFKMFVAACITFLMIDFVILIQMSNNYRYDITKISEKFKNMEKDINSTKYNKISTTNNDEIGDLCEAYNYISEISRNSQDTLLEKERLATLGQMVAGIAHNLKTPIFSMSGGLEGLQDLINEYDSSIDDPTVNSKDMHDIANDMSEWIVKMRSYNEYMSDVITAVKGQVVKLSDDAIADFDVDELFKYVNILMKHELNNSLVRLEIINKVSKNHKIHGNINSLVQILDNLITNAIQVYDGKSDQKIILKAVEDFKSKITITVQDFGPGIDESIKEKLFKEMITTKGKSGTGLGLFMSSSTIKAQFNGKMTFTSSDKGTIFIIELPIA